MFGYFFPDIIYDSVYDIDYGALKEKNIKGIIFDIDNTLVSYKQENPTREVRALMDKLTACGFLVCFVSNNTKQRVDAFNGEFKFFSFADAKKPSARYVREALKAMGLPKENAVFIGDQLFTDVAAAKRAGIMAVLVNPIEPLESLFFKLKRFMEKPFIKIYYSRQNKRKIGDRQ